MNRTAKISLIAAAALMLVCAAVTTALCFAGGKADKTVTIAKAKIAAAEYCMEKYGEKPKIISANGIYSAGSMFGSGTLVAVRLDCGGYEVIAAQDVIIDNREYDEIVNAYTEKYLHNSGLFSSAESSVVFSWRYDCLLENQYRFTEVKYSGDIDAFLAQAKPDISVRQTCAGYPELSESTPEALRGYLRGLTEAAPAVLSVFVEITDPSKQLPVMAAKYENSAIINPPTAYEEYMALIAQGSAGKTADGTEINVYSPRFYEIDEYTAISDNNIDCSITSGGQFSFSQKDYSENTTAYRGRFKYDDRKDENVLTIREDGFAVSLNERLHDYMLRLDREYYNIRDNTIVLRVTDVLDHSDYAGKRLYISLGYAPYDTDGEHWYYMDDKYLYLYVSHIAVDLSGLEDDNVTCFAFADVEGFCAV